MNRLPPAKPYRPRTPSGHDIPIPESVFQAIHSVGQSVNALTQEVRVKAAADDVRFAKVEALAEKASAASVERWTNLAKALVPAVIAIVGGVTGMAKLTERSAPEPTRVHESALSAELVQCQAKPEAEQRYCVANAYENDKLRRAGRP
jgi:hypothetical protein